MDGDVVFDFGNHIQRDPVNVQNGLIKSPFVT